MERMPTPLEERLNVRALVPVRTLLPPLNFRARDAATVCITA